MASAFDTTSLSSGVGPVGLSAVPAGGATSAATVPSSIPTAAPPGFGQQIDAQMQQLAATIQRPLDPTAAYTSIPGAHAGAVPSSFQRPTEQYQQRPMTDTHSIVGRKAAMKAGVTNAITGATNAIGQVMSKVAQNRQDNIRDAATKVINAQQAIDQAKMARDQIIASGGSPEMAAKYEAMIAQNTQVRDTTLADNKYGKALQKGFNISYTDPSANKTEEHAAVQEAIKNAHTAAEKKAALQQLQEQQAQARGKAMGASYEASQPQGLAPNVLAQQQYAAGLEQKKLASELYKDFSTMRASVYRSDSNVSAAGVRAIGAGMLQQANFAHQEDMLNKRFEQAKQLMGDRFQNSLKLLWARGAQARITARDIWSDRQADPATIYTKMRKAADEYGKNSVSDGNLLVSLQNARMNQYLDTKGQAIPESKVNQAAVQDIDRQVELVKLKLESDQANAKQFTTQANTYADAFKLNQGVDYGGGADGASGTNASTNQQSDAVGGTDYSDPTTYLYEQDSNNE